MSDDSFDSTWALRQIDQLCDRFERECRANQNPTIESFVAEWIGQLFQASGQDRTDSPPEIERKRILDLLVENLIATEIEYHRAQGVSVERELYQARFPQYLDAVARAFSFLELSAESSADPDAGSYSLVGQEDDFVEAKFEGPGQTICGECFREFSPIGKRGGRGVECPYCGHTILSQVDPATSTAVGGVPRDIRLPERFEILTILGEGAFGVVCKAFDKTLQRNVAIKAPKENSVHKDLFLREARAASRLRHPNIVRVYDAGEMEGHVYIVSDLIEGQTLRQWQAYQVQSQNAICRMMIKIAKAVHYSHDNGVIHRDLKPGNIVVDQMDEPNVLDFGLSHSVRQLEDSIAVLGRPFGTPAFMPPEQVMGKSAEIDARSDVYSMGVILFQLLTKKLPYSGSSDKIFHDILSVDPMRPREINPHIPASLEAICCNAMSRNRDERYATAQAFADDLQRFLDGRIVIAYPHWQWRVLAGFVRRKALRIGSVAAVLLMGLSTWLLFRDRSSNEVQLQRILIGSSPPSANLTWIRFDDDSVELVPEESVQTIAGETVELRPGFYKVVATTGREYFEVFRTVPRPDQLPVQSLSGVALPQNHFQWEAGAAVLDDIVIVPADRLDRELARISAGIVEIPNDPRLSILFAGKSFTVSDYLIDRNEVTFGDIRAAFPQITGLPEEPDGLPAHSISFDIAVAYAERVGMNLPTFWEFVWAASNQGTTRYSWGSQQPELEVFEAIENPTRFLDRTPGEPWIEDLILGRAEWTETARTGVRLPPPAPGMASGYIPGSLTEIMIYGPMPAREGIAPTMESWPQASKPGDYYNSSSVFDNTGFRCVRRLGK